MGKPSYDQAAQKLVALEVLRRLDELRAAILAFGHGVGEVGVVEEIEELGGELQVDLPRRASARSPGGMKKRSAQRRLIFS